MPYPLRSGKRRNQAYLICFINFLQMSKSVHDIISLTGM